jgi:hypothetical protein
MKKLITGTLMAGMMASAMASENSNNYTLVATLESERSSKLVETLVESSDSLIVSSLPVVRMEDYRYWSSVNDEILVTASCKKMNGQLVKEPHQEPIFANIKIEGEWGVDVVSGLASENLNTAFTIEISDISDIISLGRVGEDCVSETVT